MTVASGDSGGISCGAGCFIFAAEIAGHVLPSSTFKSAVSQKQVVSALARTFTVLLASVNSLKESGSGPSSSFNRMPTIHHYSICMPKMFTNFPPYPQWLLSATAAHSKCQIWNLKCWTRMHVHHARVPNHDFCKIGPHVESLRVTSLSVLGRKGL